MISLAGYLFFLALSPILVLIVHALTIRILRCSGTVSPQLIVGFSILIGYGVVAFLGWAFYLRHLNRLNEFFWAAVYGFIVYTCLAYSYFHFFNISETARRFQILLMLKDHAMDRRDLATRYDVNDMIKTRLERLVQSGQLTHTNDQYFLKGRLLCSVAQILMMWAVLLRFLEPDKK